MPVIVVPEEDGALEAVAPAAAPSPPAPAAAVAAAFAGGLTAIAIVLVFLRPTGNAILLPDSGFDAAAPPPTPVVFAFLDFFFEVFSSSSRAAK